MKNWKIWVGFLITLFIAAAGIAVAYVWWLADPLSGRVEGQFQPVRRGAMVTSVTALGSIAAPRETTLSFGIGGRLAGLMVSEGDFVRAGSVMAELDSTDQALSVAYAEAGLALSEAKLALAQVGPSEAEIRAAEANLSAAEAVLEQAGIGPLGSEIAAAEAALRSADASLEQLMAGPSEYELTLLRANLEKTKIVLATAQREYDKWGWREGFEASSQAAALQNATIEHEGALASYNLATAGPTDDQVREAEARIADARARLESLLAEGTTREVKTAAAQVARASAELERLGRTPSPEGIAVTRAQVELAKIGVQQARRHLELTVMVAPHSGTVVSIGASVGQSIAAATPVVTLVDLSTLHVEAEVSEMLVDRVPIGGRASIRLDAFPSVTLEGSVRDIAPLATTAGALVSYRLTVVLGPTDLLIRPGMGARAEIVTTEREDVLLVPKGALRLERGNWVVSTMRGGRLQDAQVTIGERQGRMVEVLEGIAEGEQVLIHTVSPDAKLTASGLELDRDTRGASVR